MEEYCKNHPSLKALIHCRNCGNYYCESCLNKVGILYYCNEEACYQKYLEKGGEIKTPKNSKTKVIITTIVTLIFAALAGTVGKEVASGLFVPKEKIEIESSDWKFRNIPNSGLALETPFELTKGSLELPAEYRSFIKEMSVYQYSSDPISFNLAYATYSDQIEPNLDGAANGAINNMKSGKGVSGFTSSINNIYLGEIPGRMIIGNFKLHNRPVEYKGVVYISGSKSWQIIGVYLSKDENRVVVNRIINSIHISL